MIVPVPVVELVAPLDLDERCCGLSEGSTSSRQMLCQFAHSVSTSLRSLRSNSRDSSNLRRVNASSSAWACLRAASDTDWAQALR